MSTTTTTNKMGFDTIEINLVQNIFSSLPCNNFETVFKALALCEGNMSGLLC